MHDISYMDAVLFLIVAAGVVGGILYYKFKKNRWGG